MSKTTVEAGWTLGENLEFMKPDFIEICYEVHACDAKSWLNYGQRKTLEAARIRRTELRRRFKRVRIVEQRRSARVVL